MRDIATTWERSQEILNYGYPAPNEYGFFFGGTMLVPGIPAVHSDGIVFYTYGNTIVPKTARLHLLFGKGSSKNMTYCETATQKQPSIPAQHLHC